MYFKKIAVYFLSTLLASFASPALAHHGTSVNYDDSRVETLKGTVTRFVWRNPHSALLVDVMTESGEVIQHAVELPSPASMNRSRGWDRRTFKAGDVIEMKINPSRTGAPVSNVAGCDQGGCEVIINGELLSPPGPEE